MVNKKPQDEAGYFHKVKIVVTSLYPELPHGENLGATLFWLLLVQDKSFAGKHGMISSSRPPSRSMMYYFEELLESECFEARDSEARHVGFKIPRLGTKQRQAINSFLRDHVRFTVIDKRKRSSSGVKQEIGLPGHRSNWWKSTVYDYKWLKEQAEIIKKSRPAVSKVALEKAKAVFREKLTLPLSEQQILRGSIDSF